MSWRLSLLRAETAEQRGVWETWEQASKKVAGLVVLDDPGQRKKVIDALDLKVTWEQVGKWHQIVIQGEFKPARLVGLLADQEWPELGTQVIQRRAIKRGYHSGWPTQMPPRRMLQE